MSTGIVTIAAAIQISNEMINYFSLDFVMRCNVYIRKKFTY